MRRFFTAWAITVAVSWPICVSAEVPDNDQVAHKIHDLLKASGQMSGSSFVIKCQDGTACLEGRVATEEQKALALQLAGEVPEVSDVVDHLRVEPAKKPANPVVRLLSAPFNKTPTKEAETEPVRQQAEPAEAASSRAEDESPIEDEAEEAPEAPTRAPLAPKRSFASWFKHPAVHAAKSPRPREDELVAEETADEEVPPITHDESLVYPEDLARSEPAEPGNLLVRQVANLRSIFSRSEPAGQAQATPRTIQSTRGTCSACEGRVQPTSMPRVTPVSNKRYRSVSAAPGASQPQAGAAGRVRMVPMIELADGSLVPVEQGRRTQAAPYAAQRSAAASRARAMPNSRSRQSVARKQEVIEGPLVGEPAPMAGAPIAGPAPGGPLPSYVPGTAAGVAPAYYDQPHMPNYAWPSYAAHPNYAGLTYPRQYSPTAWPYIGPFYPYPQVPLGWRKVTLEWDDGWWFLDFDDTNRSYAN